MTPTPDPLLAACAKAIARSYGLVSGVPNADEMDAAAAVLRIARPAIVEECAKIADPEPLTDSAMRLYSGEMTAQEIRTARAFLSAVAHRIRALADGDKAGET